MPQSASMLTATGEIPRTSVAGRHVYEPGVLPHSPRPSVGDVVAQTRCQHDALLPALSWHPALKPSTDAPLRREEVHASGRAISARPIRCDRLPFCMSHPTP
jgi:hypothetical protein